MKKVTKNSLRGKLLGYTLISFLVVAVVVAVVAVLTVSKSMTRQRQREMEQIVALVENLYDEEFPGAFDIKLLEDGTYEVYKGQENITKRYEIIDQVKDSFGYEVTIFCRNIRVQTTMEDESGKRYLTTKAATLVAADVLDGAKDHFYTDVSIGDTKQFAYYKPIILEDGTVYGMIGVSCPTREVYIGVWNAVVPLVLVCIILSIIFCFLSVRLISNTTERIEVLQKFTNAVAGGNFQMDLPASVLNAEDELGQLARDGKKMQRAIRLLVEFDALTQLHNRRYGDKRLKQIMAKAKQSGIDFCVCIGDIDFFKKVNDTYGHEAGDEVLKEVSKVLKKHMTGNGFVARWGGEEFLVVFEQKKIEEAVAVLETILAEMRAKEIMVDEQVIRVTMSMGITEGDTSLQEDEVLKKADDMLYLAKTSGRDQIQR